MNSHANICNSYSAWLAFAIAIVSVLLATVICRSPLVRTTMTPEFNPKGYNLLDFPIREKSNLAIEIINPNSFKISIVGIGGTCGPGGCVEPVDFRPFELAAKQRATVTVEFKSPMNPGPIEVSLPVHFSSDRVRCTEIHFSGNSVEHIPAIK